jgi:hypothetical protein
MRHTPELRWLKRGCKTPGGLTGAERHCSENGRRGLPTQQRAEQLDRCRVCPVEVVKDEDERSRLRELLEQRPHRTMAAVALVLGRHLVAAGERPERGEDVREFPLGIVVEYGELSRLQSGDVLVQRIDEDRERQVALEFGCRSRENEVTASLGASGKFSQEPRLADPRFAGQVNRPGTASIQLVQELLDQTEFVGPPHEVPSTQRPTLLVPKLRAGR